MRVHWSFLIRMYRPASILAAAFALAFPWTGAFSGNAEELQVIDLAESRNASIDLNEFQWVNRLLVILADTANDPRYVEQMELLHQSPEDLIERDVIVIMDTDPSLESQVRTRMRPRGFAIVLVGKDGQILLRKPFPWSLREISRAIDKLPMRQREMRQGG